MRKNLYLILVAALALTFSQSTAMAAKTSSENLIKEAKETWAAFKDYLHDQRDEAVEHGKELLEKADAEIAELESKAAKTSGEAKDEYNKTIKNLKALRAEVAKKLEDLGNSTGAAWNSSKELGLDL